MGERTFEFKITSSEDVEKKALVFNETPVAISYFPHEEEKENVCCFEIENDNIQMSLVKKVGDRIILHLFNSSEKAQDTNIESPWTNKTHMTFKGFEIKFAEIINREIVEIQDGIF